MYYFVIFTILIVKFLVLTNEYCIVLSVCGVKIGKKSEGFGASTLILI